MNCGKYKSQITDAVDGEFPGNELQTHLMECSSCRRDFEELKQVRQWMRAMPRHSLPHEVGTAVRVEYPRRSSFTRSDRFWMLVENSLKPLAIPAAAGIVVAVLFFAVMLNALWMTPTLANPADDVQLLLRTAPRSRSYNYLPIATDGSSNLPDEPILVETHIDPQGRVYDFKVLSGPGTPQVIQSLEKVLYFTVFDPATSFGRPAPGTAILSFRTVKVLG